MKNTVQLITKWLGGKHLREIEDHYERAIAQLIISLNLITLVLFIIQQPFLFLSDYKNQAIASLGCILALVANLFIIKLLGKLKFAAHLYSLVLIDFLIISIISSNGQVNIVTLAWSIVLMLYAFFTLSKKYGFIYSLIALSILSFFLALAKEGVPVQHTKSINVFQPNVYSLVIPFAFIFLIVDQFLKTNFRARVDLENSFEEQEKLNIELASREDRLNYQLKELNRVGAHLKESEKKYRDIVELAQEGIWEVDGDGKTVYVNEKMCQILEYSKDEIIGRSFFHFMDEEGKEIAKRNIKKVIKGDQKYYDSKLVTKSGKEVWTIVSSKVELNEDGSFKAATGMLADITDRKKVEDKVKQLKEFYEGVLNQIPAEVVVYDSQKNPVFRNEASKALLTKIEVNAKTSGLTNSVYKVNTEKYLNRAIRKNTKVEWEDSLIIEGKEKNLLRILSPVYWDKDAIDQLIEYSIDITSLKESKKKLLKSLRRQRILSEVSYTLNGTDSFEERMQSVLEVIGKYLQVNRIYIFEDSEDGRHTNNAYEWNSGDLPFLLKSIKTLPYSMVPSLKGLLTENEIFNIKDVNTLPEDLSKFFSNTGAKSVILFPIACEDKAHGFVGLDHNLESKRWDMADVDMLKTISTLIDNAYNRRKAREDVEILSRFPEESPNPILRISTKGQIFYANSPGEIILKEWDTKEGEFVPSFLMERVNSVIHSNEIIFFDQKIGEKTYSITLSLYADKGYINFYAADISEMVKVNKQLAIAKEKAEQASVAKAQFLSVMSHEIRTPINAIIGLGHLLLQENPKPDQLENLKALQFSANHLIALVNDILDFSKIEAGKIDFENIEFNLGDLLQGIGQMFAPKAEEKRISLKVQPAKNLENFLIGDPIRINQILTNLIGNAIKFTSEGKVELLFNLEEKNSKKQKLTIEVKDTGIGIPQDKLKSIFENFTQANSDTTRKYGGTGLGLAISKRLVELMEGEIEVKSTEGKGTSFIINIELSKGKKITSGSTEKITAIEIDSSLKGLKVLVVEDNKMNILVAKKFLGKWGVQTFIAENGEDAIEAIQNNNVDLILMDIQMPVMDGYTSASKIRKIKGKYYQGVPIIALSANASMDVKDQVLESGMNDYLTKPFNPDQLFKVIRKYVKSHHLEEV